ncbi:MAG: hypothetical protein JO273_07455 [Methylobacteriaceae bacterium]|nr:hypothetical protein [Methylobacteriaceae bacterium]
MPRDRHGKGAMLRWFWRWLSGLVILYATAFGAAIGISWFLGLDDGVKA